MNWNVEVETRKEGKEKERLNAYAEFVKAAAMTGKKPEEKEEN